jgi:hypothetical protein
MDDFELISAYLDDALTPEVRVDLEARIAREPALAAIIAEVRASDALLRAAFDGPMHQPVPQRFLDLLQAEPQLANVVQMADYTQVPKSAANDNSKRWRWLGGAVAASLAVALIISSPFSGSGGDARIGDMTAFNTSLDKTPSATAATLSNGRKLTPQFTFASRDGGYCRQFTVSDAADADDGLACRANGQWRIKVLTRGAKPVATDNGYETAGGSANEKLDAVVAQLRAGDPMDTANEQALIHRDWK